MAVLSPFGYGEICFRDFEAVLSGALLLKPDCGHLETWPDIYGEGTYVPLDWMASDLHFKSAEVLEDRYFCDPIHPNDAGAAVFTDLVAAKLDEMRVCSSTHPSSSSLR